MIEEGEIKNSHRFLLILGRDRFGPADPETEDELKAIKDLDRLERMARAVLKAADWRELLSTR